MTTPASDPKQESKMRRLTSAEMSDPIRSRLPHANDGEKAPATPKAPAPAASKAPAEGPRRGQAAAASEPDPAEQKRRAWRYKFLPAFWTIASIMSFTVNIVLLIALLLMWQALRNIPTMSDKLLAMPDQLSVVLGGLHTNFVKMDEATIATTIPVDAIIPLNIVVPVQTTTQIRLAESVVIPNAHVRINTGELNINADAVVTLPANTPLMVTLDFPLNVQNSIPVHLDVPVNIPLNQTELHEPFVGLRQVVEPWYCLVERNATVNGMQVCSPPTNPAPAETVTP